MKSVNQAINKMYGNLPLKKFIKKSTCEKCKKETEIYEMAIVGGQDKGKKIEVAYGCICENVRLANNALQDKERKIKDKLLENFNKYSMINKDLINASFRTYHGKNQQQAYAKRLAMRYVEIFDKEESKNISFHGGVGVGKSHLAKCIVDGVIEKGCTAVFITVPTLLRKIRATFDKDADLSEDKLFRVLENVDLLVLDDLGTEKSTDWSQEKLFDLINARQGMSTVYTSNYSPEHLRDIIGDRNYSRVMYKTEVAEIEAENYRLKDKK